MTQKDLHQILDGVKKVKGIYENRFKAFCPFHKERTPSFFVDLKKQVYYCFGCHAKGKLSELETELEK